MDCLAVKEILSFWKVQVWPKIRDTKISMLEVTRFFLPRVLFLFTFPCVYVGVGVHMLHVGKPEQCLPLSLLALVPWDRVPSWTWTLRVLQPGSLDPPISSGVTGTHSHTWLLHGWVLVCTQQVFSATESSPGVFNFVLSSHRRLIHSRFYHIIAVQSCRVNHFIISRNI